MRKYLRKRGNDGTFFKFRKGEVLAIRTLFRAWNNSVGLIFVQVREL